jgi:hypothetical protein
MVGIVCGQAGGQLQQRGYVACVGPRQNPRAESTFFCDTHQVSAAPSCSSIRPAHCCAVRCWSVQMVRQPIAVRPSSQRRVLERLSLRLPRAAQFVSRLVLQLPPRARVRRVISGGPAWIPRRPASDRKAVTDGSRRNEAVRKTGTYVPFFS